MVNNGSDQISAEVERNIFKEMFDAQHEKQSELLKGHQEAISQIINACIKIGTQRLYQLNEKIHQNALKLEYVKKKPLCC